MPKFVSKSATGKYYCDVIMPNGQKVELSSDTDLNYTQWNVRIQAAWDEIQKPPPQPGQCTCLKCGKNFVCPNRMPNG